MRTFIHSTALCSLLVLSSVCGCTADIHDNAADIHDNTADVHDNEASIDDAEVRLDSTSDMGSVTAGQAVHLEITAQDVFLIEPSETPPADRAAVAGHFEFYLDTTAGASLLVTAEKSINVTIPAATPMGEHKILCRIAKHDGTPTEAISEIKLMVVARPRTC